MADPVQRYDPIDAGLFIENRKRLASLLAPNTVAIFESNDVMPKDGDDIVGFRQNSDLFYLSGIDQEKSILILYPDAPRVEWREMLFVERTSEKIAIWEGDKYSQDGAQKVSGIPQVHWLEDFSNLLRQAVLKADGIYLNTNEHLRANTEVEHRGDRLIRWCKKNYPLHQYHRVAPLMAQLRAVKAEGEIDLIRRACGITGDGLLEVLKHIRPGVMEYALEASLAKSFIERGSRGFAYKPIVASGPRANILHYLDNSQACLAGDLILFDVGAEYAGYNGDVTRVIPVSGRFTSRQKDIYNAVLRLMTACKSLLKIGSTLAQYQSEVGKVAEKELMTLGLLTPKAIAKQNPKYPAYRKYFMHGASHHLGLGVHDFADMDRRIQAGMVFTIEPGIYIPEEGVGIRLENNFVVRKEGLEDLTSHIPLTAEAIEEACAQAL